MQEIAIDTGVVYGYPITTWRQFARQIRASGQPLLRRLSAFPDAVLVAGCQHSGAFMLTRVISASDGMASYGAGRDDELNAALILAGAVAHPAIGRYCFQTTYLNESYREYFDHTGGFRLLWVLRNPYAVVWSLIRNSTGFAFNELFAACGEPLLCGRERYRYETLGGWSISKVRRACLAYNGKVCQAFALMRGLGPQWMAVVDYDDLVQGKASLLPKIYDFIELPYRPAYGESISAKGRHKASRLSRRACEMVEAVSMPVYERARALITHRA